MTKGSKLADRIILLGYTLQDVTAATGIDRWQLNDYLNGRCKPTPARLFLLCQFLHCEPETIR